MTECFVQHSFSTGLIICFEHFHLLICTVHKSINVILYQVTTQSVRVAPFHPTFFTDLWLSDCSQTRSVPWSWSALLLSAGTSSGRGGAVLWEKDAKKCCLFIFFLQILHHDLPSFCPRNKSQYIFWDRICWLHSKIFSSSFRIFKILPKKVLRADLLNSHFPFCRLRVLSIIKTDWSWME